MENPVQEAVQLPAETVQTATVLKDEKGYFLKGTSGNPNGRPKGTVTRKTAILQTFCDSILTGGGDKFKEELNKLEGKDYVQAYLALLEYAMPKMARIEHTGDADSFKITQVFKIGNVEVKL